MTFGRWFSKEKSKLLSCWHSWRMETRFVLLRIFFFWSFCHKISFSILGLLVRLFYPQIFDASVTKLPLFILTIFHPSFRLWHLMSGFWQSLTLLSPVLRTVCRSSHPQQPQCHCLLQTTSNRHIFLLFSSNENQTPQCDV